MSPTPSAVSRQLYNTHRSQLTYINCPLPSPAAQIKNPLRMLLYRSQKQLSIQCQRKQKRENIHPVLFLLIIGEEIPSITVTMVSAAMFKSILQNTRGKGGGVASTALYFGYCDALPAHPRGLSPYASLNVESNSETCCVSVNIGFARDNFRHIIQYRRQ